MKTTTITYASRDNASTVRALMWEPDEVASGGEAPRGLVQIVHGMSEHVERYEGFASFLCEQGFAVCANDHIGHGKSVSSAEDLGHMPLEVGEDVLVADVQTLRELALERLSQRCDMRVSGIPYVIFGHSMGSFITRVFLTRHAFGVRAAVLCGTGHQPRPLSTAGKALTSSLAKKHGERYVSELVDGMGAGGYGRAIKDAETDLDWIATDPEVVAEYQRDPSVRSKVHRRRISRADESWCPTPRTCVWRAGSRMRCRCCSCPAIRTRWASAAPAFTARRRCIARRALRA